MACNPWGIAGHLCYSSKEGFFEKDCTNGQINGSEWETRVEKRGREEDMG